MMDLETQTRTNSEDIQKLTINVTRIATIVENAEKRHDSDLETIKSVLQGIEKLNERMGATIGMEKDIKELQQAKADQNGDIRTLRHDLRNVENAVQGITILSDKTVKNSTDIATMTVEIDTLKNWKSTAQGATAAAKYLGRVFWLLFGGAIGLIVDFIITHPNH